jgi:hypothetical protein
MPDGDQMSLLGWPALGRLSMRYQHGGWPWVRCCHS